MRLFGAFDSGGPAAPPLSPPLWIEETRKGNVLRWTMPDDGGSPLTAYRIYRGIAGQGETLIAEVKPKDFSYRDWLRGKNLRYYYRVTAVNAYGESPNNMKVFPGQDITQNKAE